MAGNRMTAEEVAEEYPSLAADNVRAWYYHLSRWRKTGELKIGVHYKRGKNPRTHRQATVYYRPKLRAFIEQKAKEDPFCLGVVQNLPPPE